MNAVTFWRAIDELGRYVKPLLVGWAIARAARGREMMAVLTVAITATAWIFAIYASWLLANLGGGRINIPDFAMTSMFCQ